MICLFCSNQMKLKVKKIILSYNDRHTVDSLPLILNHDLQIISVWAKPWLVDFNPNKTEAMLFTLEKNITPPSLLFDQQKLIL